MSVDTNTRVSNTQAIDFSKAEQEKIASTEDVFAISECFIKQNMEAYEELAKWYDYAKDNRYSHL